MQSTVRSSAPRPLLDEFGRHDSSNSIQIDQEVSVISHRKDSLKPTTAPKHLRPQSQGANVTVTAPQLSRWNSDSRTSNTSRGSSRYPARPQARRIMSAEVDSLESNRESMKALAEFLRTKEPPPDNFMSIPDSDTMSLHSIKKSAFKIFGRKKTRKSKDPRYIHLPDSAVSAKTLNGSRHIAISIPLEHTHWIDRPESRSGLPTRPSTTSRMPLERQAAVTVLKPVMESRESAGSYSGPANNEGKRDSRTSMGSPAAEVLGSETARTIEKYYSQLNQQQKQDEASARDSSRTQNGLVPVSASMLRQDSQKTDPRHSGGTAYSTASIITPLGHSRGVSSVSTAPSISPGKLEFPPRTSSISRIPRSLQGELEQTYAQVNSSTNHDRLSTQYERTESPSSTLKSHSPPAVVRTAETARSYTPVGVEHTRGSTPKNPSPAPIHRLADVPESPLVPSFMPRPSPPPDSTTPPPDRALPQLPIPIPTPTTKNPKRTRMDSDDPTWQSRADRVKARKARDIAALRERSTNVQPSPLSDISREPSQRERERPSTAPAPVSGLVTSRRRTVSQERARLRKQNTLSAIMLVADLPPYIGAVHLSDLTTPQRFPTPSSPTKASVTGTHTPPRSLTSSNNGSDSETMARKSFPTSPRSTREGLDSRRQERRARRNTTLKERELDARLIKIERDNAMLLSTLSGIASSFGELGRILPRQGGQRARVRRERSLLGSQEDLVDGAGVKDVVGGGAMQKMRSLEPVMRELQGAAGRVSSEEVEFESFEE